MKTVLSFTIAGLGLLWWTEASSAQAVAGGSCRPVSERTQEVGCWIFANQVIGQIAEKQIFWHLDRFPNRAAAEAAKGPRGTVVEALGQTWLLTIEPAGWRPSGGQRWTAAP